MGIAIFTVALSGGSAKAMRVPRIELLHEVRIADAQVLLSDLLPGNAGASLRTQAQEISLGAAPQPGNTRVLERSALLDSIGASPDVVAKIAVPERIVVSRDARPVTVQEVVAAILRALGRGGIAGAAGLHPEDVLFQTQVLVGPGDAGLQVLRAEFDSGLRRARFLLWASRDPEVLPFFVTASLTGNPALPPAHFVTGLGHAAGKANLAPARAFAAKQEFLVSPGERATLVLSSAALRMFVDVDPLERGSLGQQVRVRMANTGKVVNARVDGHAHLEVNF